MPLYTLHEYVEGFNIQNAIAIVKEQDAKQIVLELPNGLTKQVLYKTAPKATSALDIDTRMSQCIKKIINSSLLESLRKAK